MKIIGTAAAQEFVQLGWKELMRWDQKMDEIIITTVPLPVISSVVEVAIGTFPMPVTATARVGSRSKDLREQA